MSLIWAWLVENYIEFLGSVFGVLGVWMSTRQNILCWPVGLLNVLLYIYVFYCSKLYADFGLQFFYLIMTLYGWYNWKYGGSNHSVLPVCNAGARKLIIYTFILAVSFVAIGYLLATYTDAAFPYWDSFVGVGGIIGTYMQAKKQIENWILWIIIDANCVAIYFIKDLMPTVILYFIFVVLAFIGYMQWKKDLITVQQEK